MTEFIELSATTRTTIGKANRRISGSGLLPAVVYGSGREALAVAVDRHDFELLLSHGGVSTALLKLSIDGHKPVNVIVKSMQHDAVKGAVQHVDFWAVKMDQKVTTAVPVHFVGESPGVKAGGVMTHNVQSVHVESLPTAIPDAIEADVSMLEIGSSLHVSDLPVPAGATILDAAEEIVASVVAPKSAEAEEAAEAAEVTEPEVIGEKAAETEE